MDQSKWGLYWAIIYNLLSPLSGPNTTWDFWGVFLVLILPYLVLGAEGNPYSYTLQVLKVY